MGRRGMGSDLACPQASLTLGFVLLPPCRYLHDRSASRPLRRTLSLITPQSPRVSPPCEVALRSILRPPRPGMPVTATAATATAATAIGSVSERRALRMPRNMGDPVKP